ncbi:MAG TPA: hypothetical protein VMT20_24695 [Terriglobia bacterium]|nr:hypothetical protein [Terriglobia bacterium]
MLTCVVLFGLPVGWALMAADFPQAEITNGQIRVKLYLPDAAKGFYRGTRFDWSGGILSLEYKGHHYYGPWFNSVDPKVHDYRYAGSEIIASPCSAASGPVEEFQTNGSALGWDEAKVGGTFIKIGVGVLRKDAPKYDYVKQYEIVDSGKWTVEQHHDSVEFMQELSDPSSGYGYVYRKTVRLIEGKPEMVLENTLKNTGRRAIHSDVYNHNFLVLDRQPPGPDFTISVPFQIRTPEPLDSGLAEIKGDQFLYTKVLQNEDMVQTLLQGFGSSPRDNEIRIENRRVGAGMTITGDHPLTKLNLWSIRAVLSLEPFITMTIEPGSDFSWKMSYQYYTLPRSAN